MRLSEQVAGATSGIRRGRYLDADSGAEPSPAASVLAGEYPCANMTPRRLSTRLSEDRADRLVAGRRSQRPVRAGYGCWRPPGSWPAARTGASAAAACGTRPAQSARQSGRAASRSPVRQAEGCIREADPRRFRDVSVGSPTVVLRLPDRSSAAQHDCVRNLSGYGQWQLLWEASYEGTLVSFLPQTDFLE